VIHFAPIIRSAAVCGAIISGTFFSNAARAEPAIWVIHDNDSTIYLVGTLHLLRRQTEWESAKLRKAQQQSSELWLEIVNPDDQLAAFPLIQKYGFDREHPLSSKLTPAQRERLAKIGAQDNFPVNNLESMKPWLAALTLAVLPVVKAGFDPSAGVDRSLFEEAKKEGHKIVGLETLEEQFRLLANLSEKEQLDLLESTFDDVEKGAAMLEKVAAAWMNGDTKTMEIELLGDIKEHDELVYHKIFVERNARWSAQIEKLLAGSGVQIIAVGAGHLVGPDSLQTQLARHGIKVDRY
jgi:uncharacterized protein YbaP (TraB family)